MPLFAILFVYDNAKIVLALSRTARRELMSQIAKNFLQLWISLANCHTQNYKHILLTESVVQVDCFIRESGGKDSYPEQPLVGVAPV